MIIGCHWRRRKGGGWGGGERVERRSVPSTMKGSMTLVWGGEEGRERGPKYLLT